MVKMQFLIKLLSLSFILSACSVFESNKFKSVDFAFIPFLEAYRIDKVLYTGIDTIRDIEIRFQTISQLGKSGRCWSFGDGTHKIEIDPQYWFEGSDNDRLSLLYHELGHCDLDYQHSDTTSIMNSYGLNGSYLYIAKDYYLKLFFLEGK